jgi:hypothetical protein
MMRVAVVVLGVLTLASPAAYAQVTARWTGAGTDAFEDAASWSTGAVPGAADVVIFDPGTPACRLGTDVRVAAVQTDATLAGTGRLTTTTFASGPDGRVGAGVTVALDGGDLTVAAGASVAQVVAIGAVSLAAAGRIDSLIVTAGATALFSECRGLGDLVVGNDGVAVGAGPCAAA